MFAQRDVSQRKAHKVKETCYVRNAADPALDCYCSELHKYIYIKRNGRIKERAFTSYSRFTCSCTWVRLIRALCKFSNFRLATVSYYG